MNKRELFPYSNRGSQLYVVDAEERNELNKIFFLFCCLLPSTAGKQQEKNEKRKENVLWHAIFQNHE